MGHFIRKIIGAVLDYKGVAVSGIVGCEGEACGKEESGKKGHCHCFEVRLIYPPFFYNFFLFYKGSQQNYSDKYYIGNEGHHQNIIRDVVVKLRAVHSACGRGDCQCNLNCKLQDKIKCNPAYTF